MSAPFLGNDAASDRPGVLVDDDIRALIASSNLIEGSDPESIEAASYDMRLGHQYVRQGAVRTLTDAEPTLVLKAGDFAILRSLEQLNMPLDLVGHNGMMSPWAKRGLISLFSPQIDPGFSGFLVVPVFNAGDAPIAIGREDKVFTVEFLRTTRPASVGWSERFGRQNRLIVPAAPTCLLPNLDDVVVLQDAVRNIQDRFTQIEIGWAAARGDLSAVQVILQNQKDIREKKITRWNFVLALVGIALGLILGILGSDWIRSRVKELLS